MRKLSTLRAQLDRKDLSPADKAVVVARGALESAGLQRYLGVGRQIVYQLEQPPALFRGLRDLSVRRAGRDDVAALAAVEPTDAALVEARLVRGDLVYVGHADGALLCHSWFHPGPQPFDEDQASYAAWALPDATFWSYAAASVASARTTGVFVKVFQTALRELFLERGAARVQCLVRSANESSILLHERLGFRRLGIFSSVTVPGLRWLGWAGADGAARRWLVTRGQPLVLPLPPTREAVA